LSFKPKIVTEIIKLKMLFKVSIFMISIAALSECGVLRKPKVYNALITTDENLQPSRAFPVIQPVIQETGIAYPFNSLYPYNFYDPYNTFHGSFGPNSISSADKNEFPTAPQHHFQPQPQSPPQQAPQPEFQPQAPPQEPQNRFEPTTQVAVPQEQEVLNQPESTKPENPATPAITPAQPSQNPGERPADQKPPIPLNQFGLPPSLVPLQTYTRTYPYNYPFVYDSFGNVQTYSQYPVLPPLNYYPQHQTQNLPPYQDQMPLFTLGAPQSYQQIEPVNSNNPNPEQFSNPPAPQQPINPEPINSQPAAESAEAPDLTINVPDNINIKNYESKNPEIPDVPAPPLPTTLRKQQS
jgi:hypothetical protein